MVTAMGCAVVVHRKTEECSNGLLHERRTDVRIDAHLGQLIIESNDDYRGALGMAHVAIDVSSFPEKSAS